jgi:enediyne biosynthesis protein E4
VITNGFPKDVTDHDFIQYQSELSFVATKEILLSKIPAVKIKNYAFRNNGNLTFANVSADWGIQEPSFSNGAAYADFDNDGDLDYVVNNINDPASVYRNNLQQQKREPSNYLRVKLKGGPRNVQGLGAAIRLKYGGITQTYEHSPYRGYLSSVEAVAHFGLGKATVIDELSVVWPNGKSQIIKNVPANQVLTLDFQNAKVQPQLAEMALSPLWTDVSDSVGVTYQHTELDYIDFNIQKLIPHKLSQYGPSLAVGDINADGLDDVFVAGSRYRKGSFLIQNNSGGFQLKDLLPEADSTAKPYEDAGSLLFDADADGDLDLYVVSGGYEVQATAQGYQDRLYLNDGKGGLVRSVNALPTMQESGSCVKAADYDRDGDLDLFVGGRVKSTQYPVSVSSTILRNDTPRGGAAKFTNVTPQIAQDLSNIGLVCDALWTDVDADGWTDILLCGEWMPVTLLKNTKGRFVKTPTGLEKYAGLWTSLVGGDFDNDGDTDYIVGNQGHNTLYKVSAAEPMRMYAKDFDNNGNYDAIPTVYHPDSTGQRREFPYNVREDLVKQMISTRAKFPTFGQFARAGINDLLTEAERKDAMILEFNYASSSYLQNVGGGQFSISALPIEAQFAPVFGMYADDVNQDGNLDVVLVGNDFGCELLQGRQDALNGLVLSGNGAGGFVPMPLAKSGFCVPADAKSVVRVSDATGRSTLIVSQNKGKLKFFRAATSSPSIRVEATDAVAIWKFTNGKTRRQELYYGDSFYAQSARRLLSSPQVLAVEIMDYRGNKRKVKP